MEQRSNGRWRVPAKLAAAAVMGMAVAACSSTVSDDVSLEAVQNRGEAIVILAAKFPEPRVCTTLTLLLRHKQNGKDRVESIVASIYGLELPAQAKLKSGSYELANMICISGNVEIVLHERRTIFSPEAKGPPPVYGRFTVAPGEVVNLGRVTIKFAAGRARLGVSDLTAEQHAWLKENRPTLTSRMVTRLIKVP